MNIKLEDRIIIIVGPNCSYKKKIIEKIEEDNEYTSTISYLKNNMYDRINFFNEIVHRLLSDKVLILNTLSVDYNELDSILYFLNEIGYNDKINIIKLDLPSICYIRDNINDVFNTINEISIYKSKNGSLHKKIDGVNEYIIKDLDNIDIVHNYSHTRSLNRNNCMI